MTITDKLTIIKKSVNDIKTVLSNKGVAYGDITTLATAIENIKSSSQSVPDGYNELTYLAKPASGTAYIDLKYKANKNTKLILDFEITSWSANNLQGLVGYSSSEYTTSFAIYLWKYASGDTNKVCSADALATPPPVLEQYITLELNKRYTYALDSNTFKVNDINVSTFTDKLDISTADNLHLFRVNSTKSQYTSAGGCMIGRVYSLKIYESDELIRDFVPVQRKDDLTYGLYDKVNGLYLAPTSTNAFTGGV